MAQARLSVRKIREVLRLKAEARLSDRQIAAVIGSARSTVQECLRRAREAGVTWPLPPQCDEEELHARLYPRAGAPPRYPTPDFAAIHAKLGRKSVTRMLLWSPLPTHSKWTALWGGLALQGTKPISRWCRMARTRISSCGTRNRYRAM